MSQRIDTQLAYATHRGFQVMRDAQRTKYTSGVDAHSRAHINTYFCCYQGSCESHLDRFFLLPTGRYYIYIYIYCMQCALKVAGRGEAVWAHVVGDHVDENNDSS